jgi:hypothetical protein
MEAKILYISDYKRRKGLMGIKLNYGQINSSEFNQSLMLLSAQNGFSSMQSSYNVARIVRQFNKELKTARELYNNFVKEFTKKDEKGNPVPLSEGATPHPYCPWELEEGKRAEFDKKIDEFLKVEVEIQSHPLKLSDLGTIKLSPQHLMALEPIMDLGDLEPAAAKP